MGITFTDFENIWLQQCNSTLVSNVQPFCFHYAVFQFGGRRSKIISHSYSKNPVSIEMTNSIVLANLRAKMTEGKCYYGQKSIWKALGFDDGSKSYVTLFM
jgi:hypothetical protein